MKLNSFARLFISAINADIVLITVIREFALENYYLMNLISSKRSFIVRKLIIFIYKFIYYSAIAHIVENRIIRKNLIHKLKKQSTDI